ncbi:MAG TPA: hypothetical protein DDX06_04480 [Curvibacter sp.]|nr:hypothetical protein [Curvibacter sp.]
MAKPHLFYDNRLGDAAVVASSTASSFAAANVADWRPYTWWKPTALPATLTVDCGSAKAADYALVYGHDLYSKGCTLEVRGSTDNFGASNVLVATVTPTSDEPLLALFNSASYRYWRLRITGGAVPTLAIAAIGARLELPTWLNQPFDPVGRQIMGQSNRSERGQPLGRVVQFEAWKEQIKLERVAWSWVRSTWLAAWRAHLRSTPFVFGWEVDLYPTDLKLVTAGDKFDTPHFSGSTCDLTFDVEAVVT